MDWTVLPGYTKLGYAARERLVGRGTLDLEGRSVMVTGASAGIGEAACNELARAGALVHLVVRNRERGEEARQRISAASGSEALELHLCDVSSLASVREFATGFAASGGPLHVLVNNAGLLPAERTHTDEGFELAFATNVLGPFLLTSLLLPAAASLGAIARDQRLLRGHVHGANPTSTTSSSSGASSTAPRFYAHTKRAEVILSEEWGRRLAPDRITVHSVHPGWVATAGVQESLPRFNKVMGPLLRDPDAGRRHDRLARRLARGGPQHRRVLARPPAEAEAPDSVDPRDARGEGPRSSTSASGSAALRRAAPPILRRPRQPKETEMARYVVTIPSPMSAEEVFDYMATFSNVTEWDPTAAEAHPIDGGEPGLGARFHVLVKWMGREIALEYETTSYERPKRVVLRAENSTTISEDTVTVRPTSSGCEMTYDAELTLKGAIKLIDPLFGLAFKRLGDNAAAGLRRELGKKRSPVA